MMKLRRDVAGFAVGLLCGGVIFGGVGIASGVIATPLTESSQKVTLDGQAVSWKGTTSMATTTSSCGIWARPWTSV